MSEIVQRHNLLVKVQTQRIQDEEERFIKGDDPGDDVRYLDPPKQCPPIQTISQQRL